MKILGGVILIAIVLLVALGADNRRPRGPRYLDRIRRTGW